MAVFCFSKEYQITAAVVPNQEPSSVWTLQQAIHEMVVYYLGQHCGSEPLRAQHDVDHEVHCIGIRLSMDHKLQPVIFTFSRHLMKLKPRPKKKKGQMLGAVVHIEQTLENINDIRLCDKVAKLNMTSMTISFIHLNGIPQIGLCVALFLS